MLLRGAKTALLVAASALILEPDLVSKLFLDDQVARV